MIVTKIIKQGINSDLYINVISKQDPYRSWETFQQICSQVGQKIVYSILKDLLNYLYIAKPLRYKKKVTAIFAKVKHLVQHLQVVIMGHKTIWDSITLIVALDSLHNNFEITTAPVFH